METATATMAFIGPRRASMALVSVLQIEYSYYDISATSFRCQYGDCGQALSFWTND